MFKPRRRWTWLPALLATLSAPALAGAPGFPQLISTDRSIAGPDGNSAATGKLGPAFCFERPTRVCVPAGSTVSFTVNSGGRHSDPDTPRVPTVTLQAVDASATFSALGFTWAAHRPKPPGDDDDQPAMSLEFRGSDVRGLLAKPLELGGLRAAPGPVELHFDDQWKAEKVLRGVTLAEMVVAGWKLPAGGSFDLRNAPGSLLLKAPGGGPPLSRVAADEFPPTANSVAQGPLGGLQVTSVELTAPFEVGGVAMVGRVSLARTGAQGPWEVEAGTLARAATVSQVAMPAATGVFLCGATLERATAPDGKKLTVDGVSARAAQARHERPGSPTATWVEACSLGKVTGYSYARDQ